MVKHTQGGDYDKNQITRIHTFIVTLWRLDMGPLEENIFESAGDVVVAAG